MNLSDDEVAVAGNEPRKRKFSEGEPSLPSLVPDKFGALQGQEAERPSIQRRVLTTVNSSTGSTIPLEQYDIQGGDGRQLPQGTEVKDNSCSTWGKDIQLDLASEGTSSQPTASGSKRVDDPSSHSSTPISCTINERTSTSSAEGGPTFQQQVLAASSEHVSGFFPSSPTVIIQNVDYSTPIEPEPEPFQNDEPQQAVAELQYDESEQGFSAGSLPTALSRIYSIQNRTIRAAAAPLTGHPPRAAVRFRLEGVQSAAAILERAGSSVSASLNDLPRFPLMAHAESSEGVRHSRQSTGRYPAMINYRFASAELEASLLERMEQQQRLQDEGSDPEERICGHLISPEDLIWGSVKHYCGMVLDRETSTLLGTAILFMAPDHASNRGDRSQPPKSAWVTSVKVVEGRTEVLIKNSKGHIHVAQLMLTSTALGLALFSVHVGQGTFALHFLSRVIGPTSLRHRVFVDVDRSDRVYVTGYEEPWQSEAGTISDVRVRPGRIIDAGRHAIVEIDFTTGRLGGSIDSTVGFRGGLVVRADGLFAGVVTGEVLGDHPTNIDFSPAHNVYSLLEEL